MKQRFSNKSEVGKKFLLLKVSGLLITMPLLGVALANDNILNVASIVNRMNQTMWTPVLPSMSTFELLGAGPDLHSPLDLPRARDRKTGAEMGISLQGLQPATLGGAPVISFRPGAISAISVLSKQMAEENLIRNSQLGFHSGNGFGGSAVSDQFFAKAAPIVSAHKSIPIDDLFSDVNRVAPGSIYNRVEWDQTNGSVSVPAL